MKPIRILTRSISSAFKSVVRNLSLSIASISCIIITLIIVSVAIILSMNVNNFTKDIESDLTIVMFVKKEATDENIASLKTNIDSVPNIKDVQYKSKDDIKKEMQGENEAFNKIMSEWKDDVNPLQACYIITVENIDSIGETANTLKNLEFVDVVKYGEGTVEKVVSIFDVIQKVMVVAVIALIFVTAFLISNTIKITIYSRKNEIDIMRLVGTSNVVIKLPFLFEGLFLGFLGSIIPVLVTIYGYVFLYDKMGGVMFTSIISLIKPYNFVFQVSLVLVAIGAVVGMYGSYKSVRKYLKI
ncbi:MAG TPA: cell division protein FtsX [Firmicutes bacterium]|nr:cell division protein FtsX [Bacillota bacterium]